MPFIIQGLFTNYDPRPLGGVGVSAFIINSITTTGGTYPINGTIDTTQTITSGGTTYAIYSFSQTGITYTINYTCYSASKPIYVMAIGGGGGGGIFGGTGGGGAGGMIDQSFNLTTGTSSISIVIGAGGSGAPTATGAAYSTNSGAHGGNTIVSFASIGTQVIAGGGCGSFGGSTTAVPTSAYTLFGSGCGGGYNSQSYFNANTNETGASYYTPLTIYANHGGSGLTQDCGGGGGAGTYANNVSTTVSTPGGNGRQCTSLGIKDFTGTGSTPYGNYYWAGGGGGGNGNVGHNAGNGGLGGGGGGGTYSGGTAGNGGGTAINSGTAGVAGNGTGGNSGNGGNGGQYTGGGGGGSGNTTGGNGGQGIVVIAFPIS